MARRLLTILLACVTAVMSAVIAVPGGAHGTADRAAKRERVTIKVDWPAAPVAGRRVVVHVRRNVARPTTLKLERLGPRGRRVLRTRRVSSRDATFRLRAPGNRTVLRVVSTTSTTRAQSAKAFGPLPPRRHATRRYGQGPLRAAISGQPLSLSFRGKRGQLVGFSRPGSSCDRVVLRRQGASKPRRGIGVGDSRVWRLPRSGRFTFRTSPCWWKPATRSLQLVRIRKVPVPVDGPRVKVRVRRAFTDAAVIRTTLAERIAVRSWTSTRAWSVVVTPSWRRASGVRQSPAMLPVDGPVHDGAWLRGFDSGEPVEAGRYLFVPKTTTRVTATTPVRVDATLDGPEVTVGDDGITGRERIIRFDAQAGDLVYSTQLNRSESGVNIELADAPGQLVWDFGRGSGWIVPTTGSHELRITSGLATATEPTLALRVRRARRLPDLVVGTSRTFEAQEPGQWVSAELVQPADQGPVGTFAASAVAMTGPWSAVVATQRTPSCPPGPNTPNGCFDYTFSTVIPTALSASLTLFPWDPIYVVLRTPPGATGSVDLAVTSQP